MPTGPRPSPPSRTVKLVYGGTYSGLPWNNVMWLFLTGSGEITTADLTSLASHCSSAYGNNLMPILSSLSILSSTQAVLYVDGGPFEATVGSGVAGGHSVGQLEPISIALCISWQLAAHYRGGKPRTYLCGIQGGDVASVKSFSGTYVTQALNAATAFHAALEAIPSIGTGIASVEHGVVSFQRNKQWRNPPVFERIVGQSVDSRLDTQRRRLGPDIA